MDIYQESAQLHKEHKGKMEIKSKVRVNNKKDLSLAYSPGVAEISRLIAQDENNLYTHTIKANTIAVISDGSAILGLGNLGPKAALPVMEGKCVLFKEFAGVDAIPICLDTQDSEEIIKTVKYLAPAFGGINLEDISAPRCFEIEERLKKELDIPVMHDDQHGTAVVVLAGLINSLKLKNMQASEARVVILGAGAAGAAISKLLYKYGFQNIILVDSQGIVYAGREGLSESKASLAAYTNKDLKKGSLADALVGADVFIGVSKAGMLKSEMISTMAEKAVIFALANPIPEIMPEEAKAAGAYIVATGRSDYPNQVNNVLAFPGIFRGALDKRVNEISEEMLMRAANNLAKVVKYPEPDKILPDPFDKEVAKTVSQAIY